MALPPAEAPAVACAENIALLQALHSIPCRPFGNAVDPVLRRESGYTLSFEQERKLVGALAFLSSISDNPNHVAAVCIEEDHDEKSLRVLLALNKSKRGDGSHVLEELKRGFESVLEPLARGTRLSTDDSVPPADAMEEDVFSAIVSMCRERILCRLRLISNTRKKEKKPFKDVLQQAVGSLGQIRGKNGKNGKGNTAKTFAQVVDRARAVVKLIDAWVHYQVPVRLEELINGIYRLQNTAGFSNAINAIPNTHMEPTSRENLLNITRKVARYREVAQFLCYTARAVPLARRAAIILVDLPPAAFDRTLPGEDYEPDISAKIVQVCGPKRHSGEKLDNIYGSLKTDRATATECFSSQARKTLEEAKIHAEIQLLVYCDQRTASSPTKRLPPRVVRSSKDACFLCNAFIEMHKKMYTSRCHGKLYPGWRLPQSLSLSIQKKFNNVLETQIRTSMATLRQRKKKTEYPDPNESTLTSLPSLPLIRLPSVPLHDQVSQLDPGGAAGTTAEPPPAEDVVGDVVIGESVKPSAKSLPHRNPARQATEAATGSSEQGLENNPTQSNRISREASPILSGQEPEDNATPRRPSLSVEDVVSDATLKSKTELAAQHSPTELVAGTATGPRGEDQNNQAQRGSTPERAIRDPVWSGSIRDGTTSLLYNIQPFEIEVEYATGASCRSNVGQEKEVRFCIEQLTADQAERLKEEHPASILDVDGLRLGDEVAHSLDSLGCLFITAKYSVVKISFLFPSLDKQGNG